MRLPENRRDLFAEPMGRIMNDAVEKSDIINAMSGHAPVVTVGDRTTERIQGYGIQPDVQIVDGVERRVARQVPRGAAHTIRCSNPAAHITSDAVSAIRRAYDMPESVRVLVSGEEDLLLLPALLYAPDGAVLLYGQPARGLVVVYADDASRERARRMLELLDGDDETVAG